MINVHLKITTVDNKETLYTFKSPNRQIAKASCIATISEIKDNIEIKRISWEFNEED